MKKIFFIALAAVLAGCSQKPDPQVAELKKQVDDLNRQVSSLLQEQKNLADALLTQNLAQTNQDAVLAHKIDMLAPAAAPPAAIDPQTGLPIGTNTAEVLDPATGLPITQDEMRLSKLELQYSNLLKTINGKTTARSQAQTDPMTAYQNVVPADVLAQLRADAQKTFPTDVEMQNFAIKQQADAWLKAHGNQ